MPLLRDHILKSQTSILRYSYIIYIVINEVRMVMTSVLLVGVYEIRNKWNKWNNIF